MSESNRRDFLKYTAATGMGFWVASQVQAAPPKVVEVVEKSAPPVPVPGRATRASSAVAQPITEDPQKAYIREQIQMLGKSNPATVAQLIQTWMDEDRRN